jgi:hypothetical protein
VRRERVDARYVRVYDTSMTPYHRALNHSDISKVSKERLQVVHATLNPVTLLREIDTLKQRLAAITRAAVPKI